MMTVALSAFPCIDLSRVLRGWFAVLSGARRRCEGATAFSVIALLVCLFAFCSSLITYRVSILLFASAIVLVAILAVRSGRLLEFDLRAIVPVLPWLLVAVMAVVGYVACGGYDLAATVALVCTVALAVFSVGNTEWI